MTFCSIPEAIQDIKQGKFVIVVDDEDRENEGDLVFAAEAVSPDKINFMITHARGLVCMPMLRERLQQLDIPPMVDHKELNRCMFTLSVDYNIDTKTGISPSDRAATIKALVSDHAQPGHFDKPGHLFPLVYKDGGVLVREGHTEASVDLCKLAGMYPASVICEVINTDGSMATVPHLKEFGEKHDIKMITIADLIAFVKQHPAALQTNGASRQQSIVLK